MKKSHLFAAWSVGTVVGASVFAQGSDPFSRPATTPGPSRGRAATPAPPPPPGQFLVEWQLPGLKPAPRATMTALRSGQFTQPFESSQVEALREVGGRDSQAQPGKRVVTNNGKSYSLTEGWQADFTPILEGGNLSLRASLRPPVRKGVTPKDTAGVFKGSEADWAKGVAVGEATVKMTVTPPPGYLPPVKNVWCVVAARGTGAAGSTAPKVVADQAAAALGFAPRLVLAQVVPPAKAAQRASGSLRVEEAVTIEEGGGFSVRTEVSAVVPLAESYASVFRVQGNGWLGAPVVAGPIITGKEELFLLYIVEPGPDSANAQKQLAGVRTWTAATGQTTQATLVKEENGRVTLRKAEDSEVTLTLGQLAVYDRVLVEDARLAAPAEAR